MIFFDLFPRFLATNGVVVATEKKMPSALIDESSISKVSLLTDNIGMVYSGMGPDARVLMRKGRKQVRRCGGDCEGILTGKKRSQTSFPMCQKLNENRFFDILFPSPPPFSITQAQQYYRTYVEPIPLSQLVREMANVMQEYTQSGFVLNVEEGLE